MIEKDFKGLTLKFCDDCTDEDLILDSKEWTIRVSPVWVNKHENAFVATRKLIETMAHLIYHLNHSESEKESQTCDENHANPNVKQAQRFLFIRLSIAKVLTNDCYGQLHTLVDAMKL